jgi:elongation factor Tu
MIGRLILSTLVPGSMVLVLACAPPDATSSGPPVTCARGPVDEKPPQAGRDARPLVQVAVLGRSPLERATLTSAITKRLAGTGSTQFVAPDAVAAFKVERERGITIRRSIVTYETATRSYMHVHAPELIDEVKQIITGAIPLEGALLVTSAAGDLDGRHLSVLRNANVGCVVVFLDSGDGPPSGAELDRAEQRLRPLLSQHGFPGDSVPVVRGSLARALRGADDASIDALLRAMSRHIPPPVPPEQQPFLMPVEDIFSIANRGSVVTGRITRGVVKAGDDVELVGLANEARKTKVTAVEMFRKLLDVGRPGDTVGTLLSGIKKEDIHRGHVLAKPGSIKPCTGFRSDVYVLGADEGGRREPFSSGYRPQFYFRTIDVTGTATLPSDVRRAGPGERVAMTVQLATPVALERELRFAIREGGKTVGAGVVIETLGCRP